MAHAATKIYARSTKRMDFCFRKYENLCVMAMTDLVWRRRRSKTSEIPKMGICLFHALFDSIKLHLKMTMMTMTMIVDFIFFLRLVWYFSLFLSFAASTKCVRAYTHADSLTLSKANNRR